MNQYTAIVNLTHDTEALKLGDRDVMKLRVADNTFGKDNETLFFDVIVSAPPDIETAGRLAKGDQIVVSGTLVKRSYKAKQTTKYAKKGEKVIAFSVPFGRILQVTKSPSFFGQDEAGAEDTQTEGSTDAPPLDGAGEGTDAPLADI